MSRAPSAETQLRNLKRNMREIEKRLDEIVARIRQQEAAEWRRRFDELLFQRGKP